MARTSTLNVSLTSRLRDFVDQQIAGGRYESASEVVRDGLRALEQREHSEEAFWTHVREQVAAGVAAINAGDVADGEAFMDSLESPLLARKTVKRRRVR